MLDQCTCDSYSCPCLTQRDHCFDPAVHPFHHCCSCSSSDRIHVNVNLTLCTSCASPIVKVAAPFQVTKKEDSVKSITKIGAWGGSGGVPFSFRPAGGGITKIIVKSGGAVDSLSFVGCHGTGKHIFSDRFGGRGGTRREITLNWPGEYLMTISGTIGMIGYHPGMKLIRSLEFRTNNGRKLGPFGMADGSEFNLTMEGSAIVGFHGRKGGFVDAIGIYISPTS